MWPTCCCYGLLSSTATNDKKTNSLTFVFGLLGATAGSVGRGLRGQQLQGMPSCLHVSCVCSSTHAIARCTHACIRRRPCMHERRPKHPCCVPGARPGSASLAFMERAPWTLQSSGCCTEWPRRRGRVILKRHAALNQRMYGALGPLATVRTRDHADYGRNSCCVAFTSSTASHPCWWCSPRAVASCNRLHAPGMSTCVPSKKLAGRTLHACMHACWC